MGNIFIRQKPIKNSEKNNKISLEQITTEGYGNCTICKTNNCSGYEIYSLKYKTKSFVCKNCYNSIV